MDFMELKFKKSAKDILPKTQVEKKHTIMIVDDEEGNLISIKSLLDSDYEVITASNGRRALEKIEELEDPSIIHLIISDQRMPELTGVEFLARTIPIIPKTIRIILTGFTDVDDIIDSINKSNIYKFLTKPVKVEDLNLTVKNALEVYELRQQNKRLLEELKAINSNLEQKVQERTKEIENQKEVISKHANDRKELIHVLCHDLMNPVGALSSLFAQVKDDQSLFFEFFEYFLISVRNAEDIIELVRQIMVLESEKTELDTSLLNLRQMVDESLTILSSRLMEKSIDVQLDIDPDILVNVERISFINSVMNNLLTNAIKFSCTGSRIFISAHQVSGEVVISVKDSGIGIPSELLENLFKSTAYTTRHGTDGETGNGFGMPLVKKFVQAYGGDIEVLSNTKAINPSKQGTEVKITLKGT